MQAPREPGTVSSDAPGTEVTPARRDPPRATEAALDALREQEAAFDGTVAPGLIRAALRHRSPHVVARAAGLVQEHKLDGLEREVQTSLERLLGRDGSADPGSTAKLALAAALDHLEGLDSGPFERGVGLRQLEPSWGPPTDSATGLRVRCGLALARILGFDALPQLADLLADPEASVRRDSARAVAHAGGMGAVGLLRLKLRLGDPDPVEGPDVQAEVMAALAELHPEGALEVARAMLGAPVSTGRFTRGGEASPTDVAVAVALGESRIPGALEVLAGWFESLENTRDRHAAITAIGVLRSDVAKEWLLSAVARERSPAAESCVRALGIYRFQDGTEVALRRAAERNPHVDLEELVAEVLES